jgi:Ca2+-binding RTX toxin-like protein
MPTLLSVSPAAGTLAKPNANIVLTFDSPVQAGDGRLMLLDAYGNTLLTLASNGPAVAINGNTVTIDLPQDLANNAQYRLDFSYGALTAGGSFINLQPVSIVVEPLQVAVNLVGTAGDDKLDGGVQDDVLDGAAGNDFLNGRAGNDSVRGGVGDDNLRGEAGNDQLYGGDGKDHLEDSAGNNTLDGGDGDDTLYTEGGNNTLLGGAGNDTFYSVRQAVSVIDGGDGDDWVQAVIGDKVQGGAGNDTLHMFGPTDASRLGTLRGGEGSDSFSVDTYGSGPRVQVWGDGGSDIFFIGVAKEGPSDYVIADFTPGAGGDQLDIEAVARHVWQLSGNPLAPDGVVRLVQSGADTQLYYHGPAQGTIGTDYLLATLSNVRASALTRDNFTGHYAPDGTQERGLTLTGTAGADTLKGFAQGDTLNGGAGDDRLDGYGGGDLLQGGDGNDTLQGNYGDDVLDGGAGNDFLGGWMGLDTAVFAGARANYALSFPFGYTVSGTITALAGAEGKDELYYVERLRFDDVTVALDVDADGVAGKVYRLYQAAYDRKPDAGGLGFWISQADKGVSLTSIAQGFATSAEFLALYGSAPGNDALVSRIYKNVLHRDADAAGKAFWLDVLERKLASVADVLNGFSESKENVAALATVIGKGFEYTPWGG